MNKTIRLLIPPDNRRISGDCSPMSWIREVPIMSNKDAKVLKLHYLPESWCSVHGTFVKDYIALKKCTRSGVALRAGVCLVRPECTTYKSMLRQCEEGTKQL
jgi:hypothetical protein